MAEQLSMIDVLCPPPPAPRVEPVKREVMTRAYGRNHVLTVIDHEPDPTEIEVRDTPCAIQFNFGFNTYAARHRGIRMTVTTGPSYRTMAAIAHSHEDQSRQYPAATGGRLLMFARSLAEKTCWPEP